MRELTYLRHSLGAISHGVLQLVGRIRWQSSFPGEGKTASFEGNWCPSAHSVQLLSHVWLFATPQTAAPQASLSITNSQSLLKSIESVMPSNHLIFYCPLLLLPSILPSIRVFSNESALRIRWPKYWSFSFSITPSNEHPGLISFRMDWLDLLAVQGTLKSLLQYHSSKASILCCSAFFIVQTLQVLVKCIEQQSPSFLAPETSFMEDNFSTDQGGGGGKVSEWFKSITFIIHFISIIITLLYIMK